MAGTMDGLGIPINGGYTAYQSDGTTSYLTVNSDGTQDFSFSDEGADNFISVTVTDSTTITTGYIQPFYANITYSGAMSTGNSQINAFATDISLTGTVSSEVEGFYAYISGTGTLTSANISGMVVNIASLGGAASTRCGLQIHIEDGNVASSQDAFILCRLEGSSGAATNLIQKSGTATNPEYFLTTNASDGMVTAYSASDSADKALRVQIAGSVYNIPMVPDSCS